MKQYVCQSCSYYTLNLYDYNKHLKTKKHISKIEEKSSIPLKINIDSLQKRECIYCKKFYSTRQSLWSHLKICKEKNNKDNNDRLISEIKNHFNDTASKKELLTSLFTKNDILELLHNSSL